MADHIGDEIAAPKIKESKHGTEHERDDDVGPAAGGDPSGQHCADNRDDADPG